MTSLQGQPADAGSMAGEDRKGGRAKLDPIFDISGIDLDRQIHDRAHIERFIPHRDKMSLLDGIVWESDDFRRGVAVWQVRDDEFWVKGHFPAKPLVPGVLMVEAGAQLACYLYNSRGQEPAVVLFLRLDHASFRAGVEPGDRLILLCNEIKAGRRRFSCDMQGFVGDRLAFEATITGMRTDTPADASAR